LLVLAVFDTSCKRAPPRPLEVRTALWGAEAGAPPASAGLTVGDIGKYRVALARGKTADGRPVIGLRSFERGGTPMVLVVSPGDLKTQLLRQDQVDLVPTTWAELGRTSSPYLRALGDASQHASALEDAGITHVLPAEHGVVLTVDLCPSRKPLDEVLFKRVVASFSPEEHPVPIALAVTGLWMEEHPAELDELQRLVHSGKLDITWINHSYHHRFDPKLPLPNNFLLEKGTSVEDEVLRNEIAMIAHGLTPSPLFRFPGLISDSKLVREVIGYGLIPVGSDAWLAKREQAHQGDIVLVHGNGNEPTGITAFLALLGKEGREIKQRQFLLLDIREGIEDEER
jgi:peptidoglycan/xylan/chitin deacetylase (PgdA/CDA1 family)